MIVQLVCAYGGVCSCMTTKKARLMKKLISWSCGMLEVGLPTRAVGLYFTTPSMVCYCCSTCL